jgi:hypothetical protein
MWKDKTFVKETIPQFMHIPLPGTFGKAVGRMWKKIEDSEAGPEMKDFLMLSTETSMWKGEIYINTTKEIANAENVKLSGTFWTKVFDGPYSDAPKWINSMRAFLAAKGKAAKNWLFYYTYCPKCAKKYGHNYVVTFAQL